MTGHAYVTARHATGDTLAVSPPFSFDGVTVRVFPLKANMHRLRRFCDAYLNLAPEVATFRPALPYVYLMVLDYGKMAVDAANFGWIAQREITFTVPLEWYVSEPDGPRFHDYASISPFIFVDDQTSLTTGREVYGWPKTFAWLNAEVSGWARDPRAAERLMSLSTMVFPRVYAGERQAPRVLLEIEREPPARLLRLPPDATGLLRTLPDALAGWLDVMRDGLEMAAALPVSGYARTRDPDSLVDMSLRALAQANVFSADTYLNQVNVKQFRDAADPTRLCYQAVTCSEMGVRRYNDGGMLGEGGLLRGDPGGGFRLHLHRYTTQPIIETLGIEVAEEREMQGHVVSTLRPTLPFWLDMDLDYGLGETLCWRTCGPDTRWRVPHPAHGRDDVVDTPTAVGDDRFNTTRGAAIQNLVGPFDFPSMTLRVLPLLAERERLQAFCDEYLNITDRHRFEPFGSFVYVLVSSFESMTSERDNVGRLDNRELEFAVPVRWYHRGADGEQLVSLALVSPFVYAHSSTLAITEREVLGRNTVAAKLRSPDDTWMERNGPVTDRDLLEVHANVFPVLGMGQRSEQRKLIAVTQADVLGERDAEGWKRVIDGWGAPLVADHEKKVAFAAAEPALCDDARALALEFLALRGRLNGISLKQIRDSADPAYTCYQALVHTPRCIEQVFDLREIEDRMHLHIHRYPDHPIAEVLGLVKKSTRTADGSVIDSFQPLRPFWMRLAMRQERSANLCSRAGDGSWRHEPAQGPPPGLYFTGGVGPDGSPRPCVGRALVEAVDCECIPLDQDAPPTLKQNLATAAREWLEQGRYGARGRLTPARARQVLEKLDEPHLVIESVLSREWLNWGNPRWFRELQQRRAAMQRQADDEATTAHAHTHESFQPQHVAEFRLRADSFGWQRLGLVQKFHADHHFDTDADGFCHVAPPPKPKPKPTRGDRKGTSGRGGRRTPRR